MSHYFQHYSSNENNITNSTLMLFNYIYQHSPAKLQIILETLTEDSNKINIGLEFKNQHCEKNSDKKSILDGYISQSEFNLYIEAKLYGDKNDDQLQNHLNNIKNKPNAILLCLTKNKVDAGRIDGVSYTTYDKVVETVDAVIKEWEGNLQAILNDYRDLLEECKLLTNPLMMFVSAAGETLEINQESGVYYDGIHRPKRTYANYIGMYKDKAIRLIGKIEAVITYDGGNNFIAERGEVTESHKEKILHSIKLSKTIGWNDIGNRTHRYFITNFYETEFEKQSKGGLLGLKYFNLRDEYEIKEGTQIQEIAEQLKKKSW